MLQFEKNTCAFGRQLTVRVSAIWIGKGREESEPIEANIKAIAPQL
jgi:hypothetical protein